jgi:hypothetical protein
MTLTRISSEPEIHHRIFQSMTRKQQLGVWFLLTLMLAIVLYRWFNLPQ